MGFDHGASPELAPQASAIAPFGVFGDLRWISVYHESWPGLVVEVAAMLFVRGALTAYSVFLAWPAHVPSPSGRRLLSRGVFATALAAVLLAPSVVLLFSLATVPVSWLFLAAVPSALLVAFIAHPVGVSNDWWRRLFAPRALGWVLLAFLTLSLASAAMAVAPPVLWPVISGLTGLFNAWSWVGLVHVVVDRRPARYVVPAVPLATVALVGVVIGGTVLGFAHVRDVKADASPLGVAGASTGPPAGTGQPVLIVSGYGSSWDGRDRHPVPGNFLEEPFSYRGLDRDRRAAPVHRDGHGQSGAQTGQHVPGPGLGPLSADRSEGRRGGGERRCAGGKNGAARRAGISSRNAGDGEPPRRPRSSFLPDQR